MPKFAQHACLTEDVCDSLVSFLEFKDCFSLCFSDRDSGLKSKMLAVARAKRVESILESLEDLPDYPFSVPGTNERCEAHCRVEGADASDTTWESYAGYVCQHWELDREKEKNIEEWFEEMADHLEEQEKDWKSYFRHHNMFPEAQRLLLLLSKSSKVSWKWYPDDELIENVTCVLFECQNVRASVCFTEQTVDPVGIGSFL